MTSGINIYTLWKHQARMCFRQPLWRARHWEMHYTIWAYLRLSFFFFLWRTRWNWIPFDTFFSMHVSCQQPGYHTVKPLCTRQPKQTSRTKTACAFSLIRSKSECGKQCRHKESLMASIKKCMSHNGETIYSLSGVPPRSRSSLQEPGHGAQTIYWLGVTFAPATSTD